MHTESTGAYYNILHVESANIENTEEETQVTNECVNDMDVEY